jgi:molecular chaperone GrpE
LAKYLTTNKGFLVLKTGKEMRKRSQKTDKQEEMMKKKVAEESAEQQRGTAEETEATAERGEATTENHEEKPEQHERTAEQQVAASDKEGYEGETPEEEIDGKGDKHGEEEEALAEEKTKEQDLEEKLAELQDRYLRLSAEYDNYRKRTLREKIELQEVVREDIFVNILSVVDDLERAMEAVKNAKDIEAVRAGMGLIHTKFTKYLHGQGVKEIDAIGKELDTDQHEAITKIPVERKKEKGKIVDVIEKGYMLRDRVIRFAKVVIGE